MKFEFENRTLVLTGANGGIGRAIAELFHASGANLVLTDLDREGLDAFAASLGSPERIATIKADASSADDAEKTVALAMERFGGIDFLCAIGGYLSGETLRRNVGCRLAPHDFDQSGWRLLSVQARFARLEGGFLHRHAGFARGLSRRLCERALRRDQGRHGFHDPCALA